MTAVCYGYNGKTSMRESDVTQHLKATNLHRILLRQPTFADAMKAGEIRADGNSNELSKFFDFFCAPATEPPAATAR